MEALKDPISIDGGARQVFESAIVSGAFKMEENIRSFVPLLKALGPNGEDGELLGPFGKLGKCKIRFPKGYLGPPNGVIKFISK